MVEPLVVVLVVLNVDHGLVLADIVQDHDVEVGHDFDFAARVVVDELVDDVFLYVWLLSDIVVELLCFVDDLDDVHLVGVVVYFCCSVILLDVDEPLDVHHDDLFDVYQVVLADHLVDVGLLLTHDVILAFVLLDAGFDVLCFALILLADLVDADLVDADLGVRWTPQSLCCAQTC